MSTNSSSYRQNIGPRLTSLVGTSVLHDSHSINFFPVVLDGIHNLLKLAGKDLENVTSQIEECGGLDKIESLQNHENVDIYKLAYEIIEKFFNDEVKATLSFT